MRVEDGLHEFQDDLDVELEIPYDELKDRVLAMDLETSEVNLFDEKGIKGLFVNYDDTFLVFWIMRNHDGRLVTKTERKKLAGLVRILS